MAGKKNNRPSWREGQTVWVFDPKPRRWMIAKVDKDVRAGDYYCVVRYLKDDSNPEYARLVFIGVPRRLWGKDLLRLDKRPHAVGV